MIVQLFTFANSIEYANTVYGIIRSNDGMTSVIYCLVRANGSVRIFVRFLCNKIYALMGEGRVGKKRR